MKRFQNLVLVSLLFVLFNPSISFAKVIFEKEFKAEAKKEFVFEVKKWGRFSIQVENPAGTSIQLVDKKMGPGNTFGVPGSKDGRIDKFLDVGEYKVITKSSALDSGIVKLKVYDFKELNQSKPQYIKPLKEYSSDLNDLEQIS
ncbi:hypothetical protein OAA91_01915, partial [Fibrobacterales bacterium]|nr:hypothetical protein [Fibrobacterales bacterium]